MRLQELQRAVGARDEFIATVAHELRNPIAPLTFQVRLALTKIEQMTAAGTPISADWVQSQLRGIEHRLHRLLETLDRLLDVSRLSTGRIDLQPEPMNLASVVRDVIGTLEAEFAVARCKLTWSDHGDSHRHMGSATSGADLPEPAVKCVSLWCWTPHRGGGQLPMRTSRRFVCATMASVFRPDQHGTNLRALRARCRAA